MIDWSIPIPAHTAETLVGVALMLVLLGLRQFWLSFFKIDERLEAQQEIARNTRPKPSPAAPVRAPVAPAAPTPASGPSDEWVDN